MPRMSEVEMQYSSRENWYALRIRSRFDQLSERALKNKRFEVFNPTYHEWSRRKDRKKLLKKSIFKEYMFLRTTLTAEIHLEILKSYGVMQFLQNRTGPVLVPSQSNRQHTPARAARGTLFPRSGICPGGLGPYP